MYKVVGYVVLVKDEVFSGTVDSSVEVVGIIVVVLKLVGAKNFNEVVVFAISCIVIQIIL